MPTSTDLDLLGILLEVVATLLSHYPISFSSAQPIIIRPEFKDISQEVSNAWPPELSKIPQSDVMWRAMKSFVAKSKRLDPNVQIRK